jgi:hypothetical protein
MMSLFDKTRIVGLENQLAQAKGDYAAIKNQFDVLTVDLKKERNDHLATKDLLQAERDAHTKTSGSLTRAEANVSRLEKYCDLRGVDKNQVIAPPAQITDRLSLADYERKMAAEKNPAARAQLAAEFEKAAKENRLVS